MRIEPSRSVDEVCARGEVARGSGVGIPVHIDELLEQVAHDLRSPLQTIALETSLLGDRMTNGDRAGVSRAIARIERNVAFIDRVIQDLLDSAALAAKQIQMKRKPTELGGLLHRVVDRVVATRDGERVAVEAPDAVTVEIDDLQIERVVANLLQNALKYAPRGSAITVRLEVVPDVARVSVIDAGPGLTATETTYIFDKYLRAAGAADHEGYGLGLHVSKQIVEAHGGTIGVDSVPSVGSQFYFDLPLA